MRPIKPNFFIIGAPNCGGLSLATWLGRHPEVCISNPLQPHYFSPNRERAYASVDEYEAGFSHARATHRAIGEISTHTIYYPEAIGRILDYQPDARLIVCLRNPVEMALTYLTQLLRVQRQPVDGFLEAWFSRDPVSSCYHRDDIPACNFYRSQCALGALYTRLAGLVPRDRLLPIVLDDLALSPSKELKRVTDFLGIAPMRVGASNPFAERPGRLEERSSNPALAALYRWTDWLSRTGEKSARPLDPVIHEMLAAYFEIDIRKLERALGRSFSNWRHPTIMLRPEMRSLPGFGWLSSETIDAPRAAPPLGATAGA